MGNKLRKYFPEILIVIGIILFVYGILFVPYPEFKNPPEELYNQLPQSSQILLIFLIGFLIIAVGFFYWTDPEARTIITIIYFSILLFWILLIIGYELVGWKDYKGMYRPFFLGVGGILQFYGEYFRKKRSKTSRSEQIE